jgi:hypothetical protein
MVQTVVMSVGVEVDRKLNGEVKEPRGRQRRSGEPRVECRAVNGKVGPSRGVKRRRRGWCGIRRTGLKGRRDDGLRKGEHEANETRRRSDLRLNGPRDPRQVQKIKKDKFRLRYGVLWKVEDAIDLLPVVCRLNHIKMTTNGILIHWPDSKVLKLVRQYKKVVPVGGMTTVGM